MTALVIAEHDNQSLKPASLHAVTAAKELAKEIDILIIGHACQTVGEQAAKIKGIQRVLIADAIEYTHRLAENVAQLIAKKGKNYTAILATATTFSKNVLPRAAALLDVGMLSDVIKIISPTLFVRPIYAGNALATIQSEEPIKIFTVRGTAFLPAELSSEKQALLEAIPDVIRNDLTTFGWQKLHATTRPELTAARIIVAGGRGLKSAENFKLLEKLADYLGAAIGASRAAVDAGYAPNDYQVGQTGKVVAPDLYIAIGISGAIQHLAGMKDSKIIVAINNDADAPIFQIADYGLVGDLFPILAELETTLAKK